MVKDKKVDTLFKAYKKKLIAEIGTKATTDTELTKYGKRLFGTKYIGTYSQNEKIPKSNIKQKFYIINVDTVGEPGTHWVAVVQNGNTYYIYDSYARGAKRLIPLFVKGKIIIESDRSDAEQYGDSEICGQLCLSWLCVVNELGIRSALKI